MTTTPDTACLLLVSYAFRHRGMEEFRPDFDVIDVPLGDWLAHALSLRNRPDEPPEQIIIYSATPISDQEARRLVKIIPLCSWKEKP